MPQLNVLIKPASGKCNMRCKYCFYADEKCNRDLADRGFMSMKTAEEIIKKTLEYSNGKCTFAFQGGEPTLAGLAFFKGFIKIADKYNIRAEKISYVLQTNGLLIDDEWCDFLKEHGFLVGLSVDGTKDTHDLNRKDTKGAGTYTRILRSAELLAKYKIDLNILTVMTSNVTRHIESIYKAYKNSGWFYQQYIPCLPPLGETIEDGVFAPSPEQFGKALIKMFDMWYEDQVEGRFIYIRFFENLARLMLRLTPECCGMQGRCSEQIVIEADGSVYPCDFYMLDRYYVGNINSDEIEMINENREKSGFMAEADGGKAECSECKYASLCNGGCRRERQGSSLDVLKNNYYCLGYKAFYAHAIPKMIQLLRAKGHRI